MPIGGWLLDSAIRAFRRLKWLDQTSLWQASLRVNSILFNLLIFLAAQPFATDYFLSVQSQCDYSTTRSVGVCPDEAQAADVQLVSGSVYNGITTVTFIKPLNGSDSQYGNKNLSCFFTSSDHPIDPDVPMYAVWALGPFQESATGF